MARPLRTAPFHERLEELGAEFFEGKGFERAQWFNVNRPDPAARRDGWAGHVLVGQRRDRAPGDARADGAVRPDLADQGRRSAARTPSRSCSGIATNDLSGPVGSVVYSAVCNAAGGIKSDITFTRLAEDRYQLGCNGPQDIAYLRRARRPDERVEVEEIDRRLDGRPGHRAGRPGAPRSRSRPTTCPARPSRT